MAATMADVKLAVRAARYRNAAAQGITCLRDIVQRDGYTSTDVNFQRFPIDYTGPGAFYSMNNRIYCIKEEFGKQGFGLFTTQRIEGYCVLGDYGGKVVKKWQNVMDLNYAVRIGWWPYCGLIDGAHIRDPILLDNGISVGSGGNALFAYINEPDWNEEPNVAFLTFRLNDELDDQTGYPKNLTVKVVTVKPVIEAWEALRVCYRWGRPEEKTHDCKRSGCDSEWFRQALDQYGSKRRL
jgi:hypothetical protein